MTEEEKNDQPEQEGPSEPEVDAPEEPAEGAAAEAEAEAEAEAAPAEAEEPSEEPEAEEQAGPAEDSGEEALTPKQRRRLERSRASGPPSPPRSPEERAAERAERRRAAGLARRRHRLRRRAKRGEPGVGTPPRSRPSAGRKVRTGTVVSSRASKTITVKIEITRRHPTYEKVVRRSNTVYAHDERDEANEGDVVRLVEARPLSRTKRWRLLEILERAR